MKILSIILLFYTFIPVLFCDSTEAQKKAMEIFNKLPKKLDGFFAGKEQPSKYDDPRLGVSMGYSHPMGIIVTLYLYTMGYEDIKDGVGDKAVKRASAMAKSEIEACGKRGTYKDITLLRDKIVKFPPENKFQVDFIALKYLYHFKYPYEKDPAIVVSDLLLSGLKGQIFKIRITRPAHIHKTQEKKIQELVKKLFLRIQKTDEKKK